MGVPIIRTIVFGGLYWGPLFRETTMYFQTKRSTNSMFFDLRTLSAAVCLVEAGALLFELANVLIHNADRGLQLCAASREITQSLTSFSSLKFARTGLGL